VFTDSIIHSVSFTDKGKLSLVFKQFSQKCVGEEI